MLGLPGIFGTIFDLLTVVIGFGLIVFFHELGHFVAARWAGIRVLTFAVGFGPPVVSWRRGVGIRKGSSLEDYQQLIREGRGAESSPTEYRLSALPFGGYVQMLGQDDLDPGSVSAAPDSYQNTPIWKRMIVISAGVAMNVVLAGVLFVVVFTAGLKVEPPVIGLVQPDSPAALAAAQGVGPSGGSVGLQPGDTILEIDGHAPRRFDSVALRVAMAEAGQPMDIVVRREGAAGPLLYEVTPVKSELTGLLSLGIAPPVSTRIYDPKDAASRDTIRNELGRAGLGAIGPGDRITEIDGVPVRSSLGVESVFEASAGEPVVLTIERGDRSLSVNARALPDMERAEQAGEQTGPLPLEHLLGLVPVMRVADAGDARQGLEPGDVFLRIGSIEFPSFAAGINEVRAHSKRPIELVVLRGGEIVTLEAKVSNDGLIGFTPDDTMRTDTLLAMPPGFLRDADADEAAPSPAAALIPRSGARVSKIAGEPVSNFDEIRAALLMATASERATEAEGATVMVEFGYPYAASDADKTHRAEWSLDRAALDRLDALGWHSPLPMGFFEPEQIVMQAEGPLHAVAMGVGETHRVMLNVYVMFLRLTQGSLEVQHIKGPVGIAHIGTLIADRGPIWMLFFLGLISVNLAVVNFLPLPIVDGGQFLMLLYEQIRGKPVPIPVQNAVMTAGLLLIASVFLVVTFNDIRALLGG